MHFELYLEDNLFRLFEDIKIGRYEHSAYEYFQVFDSKKRDIYKAKVRDRIVHQILFDYLCWKFEPLFIRDIYASRENKGQLKAIQALKYFIKLVHTERHSVFVLKCDVKKYFESIDHVILKRLIAKQVKDIWVQNIVSRVIESFAKEDKGIPLGNVTSQIFANIYLNELDQYVKNDLRCRYYVRYNDDMVFVSNDFKSLSEIRNQVKNFTCNVLKLNIPQDKTSISKVEWGVEFLGYTILPNAIVLRDKTKQKMFENVDGSNIESYLGILKHCNSYGLRGKVIAMVSRSNSC